MRRLNLSSRCWDCSYLCFTIWIDCFYRSGEGLADGLTAVSLTVWSLLATWISAFYTFLTFFNFGDLLPPLLILTEGLRDGVSGVGTRGSMLFPKSDLGPWDCYFWTSCELSFSTFMFLDSIIDIFLTLPGLLTFICFGCSLSFVFFVGGTYVSWTGGVWFWRGVEAIRSLEEFFDNLTLNAFWNLFFCSSRCLAYISFTLFETISSSICLWASLIGWMFEFDSPMLVFALLWT